MDHKRYTGPGTGHTVQLVYALSLQLILHHAVQQGACEGSPSPGLTSPSPPHGLDMSSATELDIGLPKEGVCVMNMPLSMPSLGGAIYPMASDSLGSRFDYISKAWSFESAIPALVTHTKEKNGDGQR